MTALTFRGLFARKSRALLTGLAVLLGVAMISGTFVFTDTIGKTFDKVFETANEGVDVVVREALDFARHLAEGCRYRMATINNESRELNMYRIDRFDAATPAESAFDSPISAMRAHIQPTATRPNRRR